MYLEHYNVTVPDLDGAIKQLLTFFPTFRLRHRAEDTIKSTFGKGQSLLRWAHVGTDDCYFALQSPAPDTDFIANPQPYFNHLGLVVDDLEPYRQRAQAMGLTWQNSTPHPARERMYVKLHEGVMLELIHYRTADNALRHQYLPEPH
ncbi:VOC family protein [Gallaecimonas sp. GXIMD1310]|uniref:VOC family protein n=1 Tax=Gallaecimonas sp. GXIMD1310 TaxID=3131926 RepID=UPI0032547448